MPIFNTYHYEPLCTEDAVRLVVLDPAAGGTTPLSCSIIQYRRSAQTMDYIAVSYAWGKPEFSRNLEIRCDGDTSYLRITRNVDALLRRLRASNKRRYIWIDAICLNQDDEIEKAQQVPLMGYIYEEAKSVFIWLGPEDNKTAMAFAFFRKANLLPEVEKVAMAKRLAVLARNIIRAAGLSDPVFALDFVAGFFDQPWFSRRWVIQEAYLARQATVLCGSYSIPLSSLITVARRIQTLDISWYSVAMITNLGMSTTKHGILELLWKFHEADCLKHKDRIAALFGLIAKNDRFPLDYTAHWTELYKQVAEFLFALGDNNTNFQMLLHLFEFGAVSQPEDTPYPSWVPHWSRSRRRALPYHSKIRNPDTWETYPTSPQRSEKSTLTFHQGVLHINWHSSISGPQGRQVIYAKVFAGLPFDEEQRGERVMSLLYDLFPSISTSILQIYALSSLLKTVVDFVYTPKECKDKCLDSADINLCIKHLSELLPWPSNAKVFNNLRLLDSLLQKFCLFQIEPFGLGPEFSWGYGIGPEQVQVGDTMIPLWRPEQRYNSPQSEEEAAIGITTMITVRYTEDEVGAQRKERIAQKGRIIGPSVCVISKQAGSYKQNQCVDTTLNDHFKTEQWYSMRLV